MATKMNNAVQIKMMLTKVVNMEMFTNVCYVVHFSGGYNNGLRDSQVLIGNYFGLKLDVGLVCRQCVYVTRYVRC